MCGIAGYISAKGKIDETLLHAMGQALKHRGPDDAGVYVNHQHTVGLVHRRLAIIDLSSAGHQPMRDNAGLLWITFNGEIYNFRSLRENLISKGVRFSSESDTEVVLYAYKEYGERCLEYLNGIFAFAIYDVSNEKLFLARDRFGVKPLHYCFLENGDIAFASEIKALAPLEHFRRSLHFPALHSYFKYRYIPAPDTIWSNCYKLPPGHYAYCDVSSMVLMVKEYYNLADAASKRIPASSEEIFEKISNVVRCEMVADVAVATLLSGGIDSGIITALSRRVMPDLRAFSIGFMPEEYSELPQAKTTANHLHVAHDYKVIDDCGDDLMQVLAYTYDEPLADSSCVPTYLLAMITGCKVKVALSGDGGDEVFAGYNWYKTIINDSAYGYALRSGMFEQYYNKILLNRFNNENLRQLLNPAIYQEMLENERNLFDQHLSKRYADTRLLQYVDIHTFLADDILVKVDRASMAHSLEVRVPLLNHELVEAVFSMREQDFPSNSTGKPLLKSLANQLLPTDIVNRPKQGFSAPVHQWSFFKRIEENLLTGPTVKDGIFRKGFIIELMEGRYSNSKAMIWMLSVFDNWYRTWRPSS